MEFIAKSSNSECKEILLELITVTNELRSHIRFKGTSQDADDSSMLGYDPDRLELLYRCIKRIFTHKIMIFTEKVSNNQLDNIVGVSNVNIVSSRMSRMFGK